METTKLTEARRSANGKAKDETKEMCEKLRAASPSERKLIFEKALAEAYAPYFGDSGDSGGLWSLAARGGSN